MNEEFKQFPRTEVAGVSMPRMLIGTNWILGYSHTSSAADKMIRAKHSHLDSTLPMFEVFTRHGINAVMGPISTTPFMLDSIKNAEQKLEKKLIMIDTPVINVDDTKQARDEAFATIKNSANNGSKFCLVHHSSAEQLVNKNKRTIDRLPDYLEMIRECGMIPGLSAHMPELITYSDDNEYDVQTYIQIFNCMGFLMQVEIEFIAKTIHNAKKPVMTIKPFAAGRVTPYVGLTFNWNAIRERDMITVGCVSEHEAAEDIEISFAAFEKRLPDLEGRSSPAKNQDVFSNKGHVGGHSRACQKDPACHK